MKIRLIKNNANVDIFSTNGEKNRIAFLINSSLSGLSNHEIEESAKSLVANMMKLNEEEKKEIKISWG